MIADVCFKGGYIDAWGRGIQKILDACKNRGLLEPVFEENSGGMLVTLFNAPSALQKGKEVTQQVGTKSGLSPDQVEVLRLCCQVQPLVAMMNAAGRQNRTKFREGVVKPLIEAGWLERTIPGKPRSRLQRYRTTETGRKALTRTGKGRS